MSKAQTQSQLTPAEHDVLSSLGLGAEFKPQNVKRLTIKAGEVLYNPGDTSTAFLILLWGNLRVEITSKSGQNIVLYRVQKSQTCLLTTAALLKSEVYFARGVAESDLTALAIPATDFHHALSTSLKFTKFILSDYAHRIENLVHLIAHISSKNIKPNVAAFLLAECEDAHVIRITPLEIAQKIGTTREAVARNLAIMQEQGLIQRERGRIILLDKDALKT